MENPDFEHTMVTMAALGAFLVAQTRHALSLVLGCCGSAAVDEENSAFASLFVCFRARARCLQSLSNYEPENLQNLQTLSSTPVVVLRCTTPPVETLAGFLHKSRHIGPQLVPV